MRLGSCKVGTVNLATVVQQTAAQYGVDPAVALAVAQQESGVCQYTASGGLVTSSKGAIGVMQLLPSTAAGLGVDPTDPYDNIKGGVLYLKQLYAQFGNWPTAIAAYNAGPGAVSAGNIPASTVSYVNSILARLGLNSAAPGIPTAVSTPLLSLATGSGAGIWFLAGLAALGLWLALE